MHRDGFMRVLVFKEGEFTVAQGLDANIVVSIEGDDVDRLMERFGLQLQLNKDLKLPPVSPDFEEIWESAVAVKIGSDEMTVRQVA